MSSARTYPTTIRLTRKQYARLRAAAVRQDRPTGRLMVLILMAWCDANSPAEGGGEERE